MLDDRLSLRGGLRLGDVLFRAYLVVLFGPLLLAVLAQPVQALVLLTGARLPLEDAGVPVALGIVTMVTLTALVGLLRTAAWHGPVVLGAGDVAWLLSSPLPRALLLRPRLARSLRKSVVVAGLAGALAGVLAANVLGDPILLRGVLGAGAGAALALVAQALAWWVVINPSRGRLALRATPLAAVGVLIVTAGAVAVPAVAWALAWSGPWGWSALLLVGPGPAVAVTAPLLAAAAGGAAAWALRQAGRPPAEELARRSSAGAAFGAAMSLGDQRMARDIAREAIDALRGPSRLRLPPPRGPRLVLLWRDASVAVRSPGRLATGLLAAIGAGASISLGLGSLAVNAPADAAQGVWLLPLGVGAALLAAWSLLDPLRSALSWPFGHVMLPWGSRRLLREHLRFPVSGLLLGGLCGVGATSMVAVSSSDVAAALGARWPALAGGALWVLVTTPALVALLAAGHLRPPPDPAERATAWITETGAMQQVATAGARAAPALLALLGPTVLLAGAVTAPAPGVATLLVVLTLGWGGLGSVLAWLWVRSRAMPWH